MEGQLLEEEVELRKEKKEIGERRVGTGAEGWQLGGSKIQWCVVVVLFVC